MLLASKSALTGYAPLPAPAAKVSISVAILLAFAKAAASLAVLLALSKLGIPTAANKAIMATTIIISTKVKPLLVVSVVEPLLFLINIVILPLSGETLRSRLKK